ncbi:hypothetical protein [Rhizobium sp.]|jgi:hypothetical protein|uniref:hypothetical protein n=1 Tax=Rhizobium sp. TaxID=391 RepID=UPI002AA85281
MRFLIMSALMAAVFAGPASADVKLKPWQSKALKAVKSEKKVVDAKWRSPENNMLWVAMQPDGSLRDGFAQYLCLVPMNAGAPEGDLKTVWIYDPANFESGIQKMGMAACR